MAMAGKIAALAALAALLVLAAAARDDSALLTATRKSNFRVNGPMGTYFNGESFFNALGAIVPNPVFEWVGDGKFIVQSGYVDKVYPSGFVYAHGKLIGQHGVYFSAGKYRTLGDTSRVLPAFWFARRAGGFYIKFQYIKQLYPRGFWFKNGGLNGPKGLYHVFNTKANRSFFYAPGSKPIANWRFKWVNGGYYVRVSSRKVVIPLLRGDPGYPPANARTTPKRPSKPSTPAKLPAGYELVQGRLFGQYGVYLYKGVYRAFGDNYRILPSSWFWQGNGVFYIRQRNVWQLYPKGYKWVNGGLSGPEGVWFKRVKGQLSGRFYVTPSFKVLPGNYFRWQAGGHLIKNQFRWAIKSTPKRPSKPSTPAKLPAGYELVQGRLFGQYGVYLYKGVYRAFGDNYRILPSSWFWKGNGVFYIRQRNVWQLYPKGYKWVNGGLSGPEGVWFKRVKGQLSGRFYVTPSFKVLPGNYFRWQAGGHLIKNQFRWAIKSTPKRPSKPSTPAKLPAGYELVQGRLFGQYGVYRYKGVYRTFGDNYRSLPPSWFWQGNGVFYIRQRNVWQLYPKGYKWVNGGLAGPDNIWFKRVKGQLNGRFYVTPSFRVLSGRYFQWYKGGHQIRKRFRWALKAKQPSKPISPGGSPHIPGTDGEGSNAGAPSLVGTSTRRPGRNGPVVKIVPHVGPRKRFETIKGRVYGDFNVVWDFNKFWTLGDPTNVLPNDIFTVQNNKFFLIPGNKWRLYPKGFTFDPKRGLVSETRIYFQRLPGRARGTFFFPGGGVVPPFYFNWQKGGFVMKQRFSSFVLNG